jgi:putative flippase GtrA
VYAPLQRISRQFAAFSGVGLVAAVVHYGLLIALVEMARWGPVAATLLGYVAGGIVSYALNRRLTYGSDRPHAEATWRFAVVAAIGLILTWAFMALFISLLGPAFYVPAQLVTTGIVLVWHFVAHKLWTFAHPAPSAAKGEG